MQYLQAVRDLLAAGKCVLLERGTPANDVNAYPQTCIGWRDDDGSGYLIPSVTRNQVEQLLGSEALGGLSNRALYSQLEALGAIASHNDNRRTKVINVEGNATRTLHLAARALQEPKPSRN
jgi:hypothetical protein